MCIYLEWLYTRLRPKLAVCIASAYKHNDRRLLSPHRGASCNLCNAANDNKTSDPKPALSSCEVKLASCDDDDGDNAMVFVTLLS